MLKKMSTLFLALLFAGSLLAQSQPMKKAPIAVEPNVAAKITNTFNTSSSKIATSWIAVDTMANIYGPAIGTINPLAYDPYSKVAGIVYRGTAATGGSGFLYYSISTDKGVSWSRVNPGINAAVKTARYPSMAISNPTKSANMADATAVFAWPALGGGAFDWVGFGADSPIGAGAPYEGTLDHDGAYSSQTPIWTDMDGDKVFWTAEYSTAPESNGNALARLFSTTDFSVVDSLMPSAFSNLDTNIGGIVIFGGIAKGNTVFIAGAASGVIDGMDTTLAIESGWYPTYMQSTDKGLTWTNWKAIDFRKIPALSAYDRLFDYKKADAFISYGGDLSMDKDGRLHIVTSLTDTTTNADVGKNAIVEIFQTATGWDGKVVLEGINDTLFTWCAGFDPALGQMGPSPYLAVNKAGDYFACQWVNGTSVTDTVCDIFIATRKLSDNAWSKPTNITSTPNMNENAAHLAPYLDGEGPNYIAFSNFPYEKGVTGYQVVQTNPAVMYCAAIPLSAVSVDKNGISVSSYQLEQNYPNPFNPSTSIRFNMAVTGNVSLKVYDVLGREVATLVNGQMAQGAHTVTFSGSNLASGLYIYKLEANNFTATHKMMLLK